MYAVVGTWSMDVGRTAEQRRALEQRIVPSAQSVAGFIQGYWTAASANGRSYSFILFDAEEAAAAFKKSVESNTENQARVGIQRNEPALVEVVAQADAPTPGAAPREQMPDREKK